MFYNTLESESRVSGVKRAPDEILYKLPINFKGGIFNGEV